MKSRLKYLAIFCSGMLLFASSCVRHLDVDDDIAPEGKVRLEMALNYVVDKEPVQSKAVAKDGEIVADHVWVLILDNKATELDRVLKQKPIKAELIENYKIYANLDPESTESWVYVLANVSTAANTYLQGLAKGALLGDIMNSPEMRLVEATSSGLTSPLPMWGTSGAVISQIKKGATLSQTVTLVRSVARIDVVVDPGIFDSNFKIHSVSLVNAAKSGWLFKPANVPAQRLTDAVKYNPADVVSSDGVGSENSIVNQIYCYENNGMLNATLKNITRIIVAGYYASKTSLSYYGVDIAYTPQAGAGVEKYDIDRNKIYKVNIKKIDKDGYASLELAESSESFNSGIVTDITVTDPYSHNIVSNGKQYMGTTNTNLLIYNKDNTGTQNILAATVSYTTESGWPRGTMTASPGITFVPGNAATESLEVGSGSNPVIRDVLINVDGNFTTGTIEVRIGNLTQVIRVSTMKTTSPGGDIIDYFASGTDVPKEDFVVAEVVNPSEDNSWLKVSNDVSALEQSSLFDKVTNPTGGVYLHVGGNIAYQSANANARKAQAFVTSKNNEQRYRVHIEQSYLDVYSGARPIKPYTYVGVFHRWNETGERLIRIEGNQVPDGGVQLSGLWTASVVHGDFIKLSTEESKDIDIDEQDPYGDKGVSTWTTDDIEALGQFNEGEGRRVVTGVIDGTTKNIYFKVGLTGRLASFNAEPRYGLISLTYTYMGATQTQFIYVRQGEAADYLMRPSDPVFYTEAYLWNNFTNSVANQKDNLVRAKEPMSIRPLARKLAPYNLRASDDNLSGLVSNVPLGNHNFVDFPSKGGDYYFMNGSKFIRKDNGSHSAGITGGNWDSSVSESCPYGYRRISDSKDINTAIDENNITVAGSENRQSYWLFPMKNMYLSNFSNQIRGFLSDGYFDRRKIGTNLKVKMDPVQTYSHSIVRNNTPEESIDKDILHAYWGFLVFNPYNYASVFMPSAGHYRNASGSTTNSEYADEGAFSGFWTRSNYQAYFPWITNYGYIGGSEVFDNYKIASVTNAYSNRCVLDEGAPVIGPVDDKVTITPFDTGTGSELYSVRIEYDQAVGSLETQLTNKFTVAGVDLSKMNALSVICNTSAKELQAADYSYINSLTNNPATNLLRHITINGAGNQNIPADAFTSKSWKSITIINAKTFADEAFNLTSDSELYNLSIGYFGVIAINKAAFVIGMPTEKMNLKIRGNALRQADKTTTPPSWLGLEWKTINEYK